MDRTIMENVKIKTGNVVQIRVAAVIFLDSARGGKRTLLQEQLCISTQYFYHFMYSISNFINCFLYVCSDVESTVLFHANVRNKSVHTR